jgi:hypothetical protein
MARRTPPKRHALSFAIVLTIDRGVRIFIYRQ